MERIIYGYADAFLALSHTESTAEIHLIAEIILSNKLLKLFHYMTGTFNVTG